MRKWGIVVSIFYALIVLGLIVPVAVFIAGADFGAHALRDTYSAWGVWIMFLVVLSCQVLLLFLSVDTSHKRLKPRTHILVSCAATAVLTALLTSAMIWSLGVAIRGDKFFDLLDNFAKRFFGDNNMYLGIFWTSTFWVTLWLLWTILFYLYYRNSSAVVNKLIAWLLKGSVLELLIAVPCHVIVRRRHDCSAPAATSFGIAGGLAIMVLSFGPSVLFLYKKRLDAYTPRTSA